jgi:hypothetical protein
MPAKAELLQLRQQLLQELKSGPQGIERWNALGLKQRQEAGHFRKADLSGQDLSCADLQSLDFQKADFTASILAKAMLGYCNLKGANLRKADLREAQGYATKMPEADLTDACLANAKLSGCNLNKAILAEADLSGAELVRADLRGANLLGANLEDAKLGYAKYDEQTRFPKGFRPPKDMKWAGTGPPPKPKRRKPSGPIDVDTFMKRLEKGTDSAKLDKALAMLKAERFKLFAQIEDEFLVGVVKSQTDPDLVYSCRLASDGRYACCTQNLNICGGLRGSLCKHLLVLIIGLTKGGELDPTLINEWVESSQGQKPALDKDAMSETFLRYKGAEAGEVDWRPTETIPEDYYAL